MFEYDPLDDLVAFGVADLDGEAGGVLNNEEDLQLAAEALAPDTSAGLVVWAHRWAARVAQAIRAAGGQIIAGERVPEAIVGQAWPAARPADEGSRRTGEEDQAMLLRPFVRNGRPGLIGTMARTTVVVGTGAGAGGGLTRRQQATAQPAARRPTAPAQLPTQLKELAALKEPGVLTDEEFTAQKAHILEP
jgi:hypothetical protein